MKTLNNLILTAIISLSAMFTGCTATSPRVIVGSDFKLGEPIKQFKTYSWSSSIDNIPTNEVFIGPHGVYIFNNVSTRSQIKDAIQYELSGRGFKMDSSNPDMIVNYLVFEKEGELRTYNGYQVVNGLDSVRTEDNVARVTVKPGTLYITISGAKNEDVVWQGYASGILSSRLIKDPAKVKAAVQQIFKEFKYKAFAN
ncbi:DUF4136 domain-containing protein [Pedobacter sp. P351]|uniref:DUF4136 domain-containing protein n=1 Tax=Pedobacter superstes TaxID=3133441 RepID=UPI0030A13946